MFRNKIKPFKKTLRDTLFFIRLTLKREISFFRLLKRVRNRILGLKSVYQILTRLTKIDFIDTDLEEKHIKIGLVDIKKTVEFRFINRTERVVLSEILKLTNEGLNSTIFNVAEKERLSDLLDAHHEKLSCDFLEGIEVLFNLSGYLSLSFKARQLVQTKYLDKYSDNRPVDYLDIRKLCILFLLNDERQRAALLLDSVRGTWRKYHAPAWDKLFKLATMEHVNFFDPYRKHPLAESAYLGLVKDKDIIMVGPTPFNERELDTFPQETITRLSIGYRGQSSLNDLGVDISYYNKATQLFMISEKNPDQDMAFLSQLSFAVTKGRTKLSRHYRLDGRNRTSLSGASNLFFNGYENMMQLVLFDLLSFSPKSIKLVGFNMFVAEKQERYRVDYNYYDSFRTRELHSYAFHNLASNYEFAKLLYKRNVFQADEPLKKVLSLSTEEYMNRLELTLFE